MHNRLRSFTTPIVFSISLWPGIVLCPSCDFGTGGSSYSLFVSTGGMDRPPMTGPGHGTQCKAESKWQEVGAKGLV